MGVDVYLEWDGQTEAEKQAQYTGFSIDAGDVGYLRASIGMGREIALMDTAFGKDSEKGYDFKANAGRVYDLITSYLDGEQIQPTEATKEYLEMGKSLRDVFKEVADSVVMSTNETEEGKKVWAKSFLNFFELGMRLQEEGKHPRVIIS